MAGGHKASEAAGSRPGALVFGEDTGAANYLADVPGMLGKMDLACTVVANDHAARHFARLGIECDNLTAAMSSEELVAARPMLVIVGAGINLDSFGLDLIAASKAAGIVTVGVVDQRQNLGDRFRGRTDAPLAYTPDWVLVPDSSARAYFVDEGVPRDRVVLCGHPHFDKMYALRDTCDASQRTALRAQLFPDCAPGRHIVIFGTEPAKSVRGSVGAYRRDRDYTLEGLSGTPYRTQIAIEEFLNALGSVEDPVYTVLRLHPHDPDDTEFADYYAEFDMVSDRGLPQQLMLASDLVVGVTSMLLVEAVILGRPTLSILPRRSDAAMLATIERGLTPHASERGEVGELLVRLIGAPQIQSAAAVEDVFPRNAAGRMQDFLGRLVGGRRALGVA